MPIVPSIPSFVTVVPTQSDQPVFSSFSPLDNSSNDQSLSHSPSTQIPTVTSSPPTQKSSDLTQTPEISPSPKPSHLPTFDTAPLPTSTFVVNKHSMVTRAK